MDPLKQRLAKYIPDKYVDVAVEAVREELVPILERAKRLDTLSDKDHTIDVVITALGGE